MEGLIKRFYRHDLESFIACLTYAMMCYKDGALSDELALRVKDWESPSCYSCAGARRSTALEPLTSRRDDVPLDMWIAMKSAANMFEDVSNESRRLRFVSEAASEFRKEGLEAPEESQQNHESRLKYLDSIHIVKELLQNSYFKLTTTKSANIKGIIRKIMACLESLPTVGPDIGSPI